ncbi:MULTISPECIES: hypothetical protein [Spirulina sp. CCY15215]|uniref:hypothetical protein n=1 Tax=Spirulina sp. CCY15215 TaxID=2767591 RepID=UPI00194E9AEB|nr:hypothetical protein [Spirulina major]
MTQTVSRETIILERLQSLTPQQQQSVLDFIEFLQFKERDRKTAEIDATLLEMVKDPEYQAEVLQLETEFAEASWEALKEVEELTE